MITTTNEVILIDYGKAEKIYLSDSTHRPNNPVACYGNPHFCSKNLLHDQTLSRRDDLIQVVYNLICLQSSFKPLRRFLGVDPLGENFKKYKKLTTAAQFCNFNNSQYLSEVLEHCYSLKYDETPDYSKIVFLMKKALMGLELGPEGIFSRSISSIDS